jgi:hypothetical protein
MQESQLRIYNEIQNIFNKNLNDNKTRLLTYLAYIILSGNKHSIELLVKSAKSYGATKKDFMKVVNCIIGDVNLLDSIFEFLRIINENFKENKNDRII